jgi:hypothetical protein
MFGAYALAAIVVDSWSGWACCGHAVFRGCAAAASTLGASFSPR